MNKNAPDAVLVPLEELSENPELVEGLDHPREPPQNELLGGE